MLVCVYVCGCETWKKDRSVDECVGCVKGMGEGVTGGWRKLHGESVRDFCCTLGSYCWCGEVT